MRFLTSLFPIPSTALARNKHWMLTKSETAEGRRQPPRSRVALTPESSNTGVRRAIYYYITFKKQPIKKEAVSRQFGVKND